MSSASRKRLLLAAAALALASGGLAIGQAGQGEDRQGEDRQGEDRKDARPDPQRAQAPSLTPARHPVRVAGFFVDRRSIGGQCDDTRSLEEAADPKRPWCTLERAVATVPGGRIVHVRGGDYPPFRVANDQGRTDYLTLRSYGTERVTMQGFTAERSRYLRLQGFTIRGAVIGPDSNDISLVDNHVAPAGVTIQDGSSKVRVERNSINAPYGSGVFLSSSYSEAPISDVVIRRNHFDDIGVVGINLRNFRNVLVEGNEMENLHRWGRGHTDVIRTYHGGSGLVVRANYLHDNQGTGFFIKDGKVSDVTLENNLIVRTKDFYAFQIYDVDSLRIVNNTIVDNDRGTVFSGRSTGVVVKNNILDSLNVIGSTRFDYEDYNYVGRGDPGGTGQHDLKSGVKFVDPGRDDYRLAPGSAGIDAGTSEGAPARGRLGRRRYDDSDVPNRGAGCARYYDIGSEERQAKPPKRKKGKGKQERRSGRRCR